MNAQILLLEFALTGAALGVMLWDLWLPKDKKDVLCWASMAAAAVLFAMSFLPLVSEPGSALGGSFVVDGLAIFLKRCFAVAAFLVFLMSREYVRDLPRGQGEFYTLGLLSLLGMFLCASVNDFMSLFVALEVVTVAFFVLVAIKRHAPKSVEAGLKLLVIGSVSAAVLLYGIAFVYGSTGTVFFDDLRAGLGETAGATAIPLSTELLVGMMLIFLGLGFKTSAVPLHVWVPDVYQGAPTPVTAYLSVGSKLAGFVLMLRCLEVFHHADWLAAELTPFLALVAALTLFYGNLGALPQSNIKRLMGYSSIGQCGYILLGVAAASGTGLALGISGTLFYMAAYVVTNLAAFAVIVLVSRATQSHEIDDYSGLGRKNPILAASLAVALMSLAGVPPFIGFFGKFMLVGSTFASPELRWLGIVGLINVVIALYYYLRVIKRIYVREEISPTPVPAPLRIKVALVVAMALLIAGGMWQGGLESVTHRVAVSIGFGDVPR